MYIDDTGNSKCMTLLHMCASRNKIYKELFKNTKPNYPKKLQIS